MNHLQAQPPRLREGDATDVLRGGTRLDRRSLIAMAGGAALASFGVNQSGHQGGQASTMSDA
jgi:hypothetical protein